MSLRQRVIGILYILIPLGNIPAAFSLLALLISILSKYPLITCSSPDELRNLTRMFCALLISDLLDNCIIGFITSYQIAMRARHATLWMAPCKFRLDP